jgi:hypothetical protein
MYLGRVRVLVDFADDLDGHEQIALLVEALEHAAEGPEAGLADDLICVRSPSVSPPPR